jgi:hypothetical protein
MLCPPALTMAGCSQQGQDKTSIWIIKFDKGKFSVSSETDLKG